MLEEWWPDWTGETAVIVGAGPSADLSKLEAIRGKARCVALNESWRLVPWADLLYGCDANWWHYRKGVPEFHGLKVCRTGGEPVRGVHYVETSTVDRMLFDEAGVIGWGGNSGFGAVNLVAQFGVARIILVGFDMSILDGLHWHGEHGLALANPTEGHADRWRKALDAAAASLRARGVTVLNASSRSALTAYRKVPLSVALRGSKLRGGSV